MAEIKTAATDRASLPAGGTVVGFDGGDLVEFPVALIDPADKAPVDQPEFTTSAKVTKSIIDFDAAELTLGDYLNYPALIMQQGANIGTVLLVPGAFYSSVPFGGPDAANPTEYVTLRQLDLRVAGDAASPFVMVDNATGVAVDDSAAILAAFNAATSGQTVFLGTGDYVIDPIVATIADGIGLNDCLASSVTISDTTATTSDGFTIGLHLTGAGEGVLRDLTADADAGDTTITVASGHGIVAGDTVIIGSDHLFSPLRDQHRDGHFARVASVTATTIELEDALRYDMLVADDAKIRTAGMVEGFTHTGGCEWRVSATTGRQTPIVLSYIRNPQINGVVIEGRDRARDGYVLRNCIGGNVSDMRADNVCDSTVSSAHEGYGLWLLASEGTRVFGLHGSKCRHLFDTGSYKGDAGGGNVICHDIWVKGGTASRCWSAAWSTHGGTDGIVFEDVEAIWCGGGGISRGPNTTWLRPRFTGTHYDQGPFTSHQSYEHMLVIGEGDDIGSNDNQGRAGENLRVIDPIFDGAGANPAGRSVATIEIRDPLDHATFRGGDLIDCQRSIAVVHCMANVVDASFTDISIDHSATEFGYRPTFSFQPGSTSTSNATSVTGTIGKLTIDNIRIEGAKGSPVRLMSNSGGYASVSGIHASAWRGGASDATAVIEVVNGSLDTLMIGMNHPNQTATLSSGATVTTTTTVTTS